MRKLYSRGDTIVEVLIAIAIVSLILAGAFVTVNRSMLNGRQAQERGEAIKYAETQLERLKEAGKDASSFVYTENWPFCFSDTSGVPITFTANIPERDSDDLASSTYAGCQTGNIPGYYNMSIERQGSNTFVARVRWNSVTGNGVEEVRFVYGFYDEALFGVATPPGPPTGGGGGGGDEEEEPEPVLCPDGSLQDGAGNCPDQPGDLVNSSTSVYGNAGCFYLSDGVTSAGHDTNTLKDENDNTGIVLNCGNHSFINFDLGGNFDISQVNIDWGPYHANINEWVVYASDGGIYEDSHFTCYYTVTSGGFPGWSLVPPARATSKNTTDARCQGSGTQSGYRYLTIGINGPSGTNIGINEVRIIGTPHD
jgi:type II secretory pathway pseudopilin PulG